MSSSLNHISPQQALPHFKALHFQRNSFQTAGQRAATQNNFPAGQRGSSFCKWAISQILIKLCNWNPNAGKHSKRPTWQDKYSFTGAEKTARFHLCFVPYNNIWDHQSKPELQNVTCYIGAELENMSLAQRDSTSKDEWDDCCTSGSKARREHSKKAKPLKADKQRPADSTAKLLWVSQLMAGENIMNFSEGRRWGSSRNIYGSFLLMAEKHPSATPPSAQSKERPQQGFAECLKASSITSWDYVSSTPQHFTAGSSRKLAYVCSCITPHMNDLQQKWSLFWTAECQEEIQTLD